MGEWGSHLHAFSLSRRSSTVRKIWRVSTVGPQSAAKAEQRRMTGAHVAKCVKARVEAVEADLEARDELVSPAGGDPEGFVRRLQTRIAKCLSDAERVPATPRAVIMGLRSAMEACTP